MTSIDLTGERPSGRVSIKGFVIVVVLLVYASVGWFVYASNTPADAEMLSRLDKCERKRMERQLSQGITASKMDVY